MTIDPTSEQLAALVRDFLDPDPCALDHHGYCQTHSWLCEGRCPHARAREVLAEYDAEQAASAGAAPADEPAPAGLGVSATPSHTDQAAAARVRALHQQYRFAGDDTTNYCAHCNLPWPCPTVQAVGEDAAAVLPPPADRAAVLREAVDTAYRIARRLDDQHHDERAKGAWDVENTLRAELRRLADEAQQQECTASISGSCLREAESETACDTDAGECVHGGRPAAEEPEPEPSVHGESVAHLAGLHGRRDQWADDEQADTLPAWLYQRFMVSGVGWDNLDEDDRSYWEHHARAVRRAVARGGFKQPAVDARQDGAQQDTDSPRTVCVCGHTRGEHLTVSGRLLCDICDPDSTDNLVCRGFDAL